MELWFYSNHDILVYCLLRAVVIPRVVYQCAPGDYRAMSCLCIVVWTGSFRKDTYAHGNFELRLDTDSLQGGHGVDARALARVDGQLSSRGTGMGQGFRCRTYSRPLLVLNRVSLHL
jgi:hypothetical protein